MRALLAQTAMELRLTARRGENLLVTLIVPVALLFFFATIDLGPPGAGIDFLVPGLLALSITASGLVSLGIATAYERHYGVLKRLGSTPLGRPRLIGAKLIALVLIELLQVLLVGGLAALAYGWRPDGAPAAAILLLLLGTAAMAGLGLTLAGLLRAEATLALANGLYLLLLLTGDLVVPLDRLPAPIAAVAPLLPAAPLAGLLRAALAGAPLPPFALAVLALWAAGGVMAAILTFRWE